MLGKLLNYATDNLLPEKYKYIGDYACAGLDVATGDYASAGIGVIEGASQNLKQMGYDEGATTLNLVSKTAGVASGDINNFIKTGSGDSFILAGAKMCAVGSATSIGAVKNGQRGANIANSLAAGSIGNSIEETALKSGLTSTGALIGYQKKGEENMSIIIKRKVLMGAAALATEAVVFGLTLGLTFGKIGNNTKDVKLGAPSAPIKEVPMAVQQLNDAFINVARAVTPAVVQIKVTSTPKAVSVPDNQNPPDDFFKFFFGPDFPFHNFNMPAPK
ncbi:MAG: hypothetical protein ACP5KG_01450, partial [Myxococcota bacterium]